MKDVVAPFNNVLLGLRVAQWVLYSRSRSRLVLLLIVNGSAIMEQVLKKKY